MAAAANIVGAGQQTQDRHPQCTPRYPGEHGTASGTPIRKRAPVFEPSSERAPFSRQCATSDCCDTARHASSALWM
jgi:hypothetical protein